MPGSERERIYPGEAGYVCDDHTCRAECACEQSGHADDFPPQLAPTDAGAGGRPPYYDRDGVPYPQSTDVARAVPADAGAGERERVAGVSKMMVDHESAREVASLALLGEPEDGWLTRSGFTHHAVAELARAYFDLTVRALSPVAQGEGLRDACRCGHPRGEHLAVVPCGGAEGACDEGCMMFRTHPAPAPRDEDLFWSDAANILCRVFDDLDAAMAEFRAWYDPTQWLHGYRALGAFIRTRLDTRPAPAPGGVTEAANLEQVFGIVMAALSWLPAKQYNRARDLILPRLTAAMQERAK